MINDIIVSRSFQREAKKLIKKFSTLKLSVDQLINDLMENPFIGTPYGANIYKVRLADPSKGRGKSGAFRVLYFQLHKIENGITIILISIYDKSEKSTVKKLDALKRLKEILIEERKR